MSIQATSDSKTQENAYTVGQFSNDLSKIVNAQEGRKDLVKLMINVSEWMAHFGIQKKAAEATTSALTPVKYGFSILHLFHDLNGLRDLFRAREEKNLNQPRKESLNHSIMGMHNAAEAVLFLNHAGIYVLKTGLRSIQAIFWTTLGVFEAATICKKIAEIETYQERLCEVKAEEQRKLLQSKVNLSCLQIVQSVTQVGLASLALIALAFACLAETITFHPLWMLALSSIWLILEFATTFYEKIIFHREENLNTLDDKKEALIL